MRRSYRFTPFSSNPAVFTDAQCYMDWIAAQYNLSLPADYTVPQSCLQSSGRQNDVNNVNCLSHKFKLHQLSNLKVEACNFTVQRKCKLFAYDFSLKPATNENFFTCRTVSNQTGICANNCPGVDPNSVVVGGEAALLSVAASASIAVAGPNLVGPVLGAGSIMAMLGLGNIAMVGNTRMGSCPQGQCRARLTGRCCLLVTFRGQRVCPSFCN